MSDEPTPNETNQVDVDKVNARIQEILSGGKSAQQDTVPINLDPAVAERLFNQGDQPESEEDLDNAAPDTPENRDRGRESTTFRSDSPETSGIKAWALQMPELTREFVSPTHMDKMLYIKAMLNDVPVEFIITLPVGNLVMKIRSLSNHEQDIVFKALDMDQQDQEIKGPAQYVTRLQYHAAVMQIVEFNKVKQDFVHFSPGDEFKDTASAAEFLRQRTRQYIGANNWPTWQVKLTGLRIFEEKLAACNRAVMDANFWMPAGTD